MRAIWVRSTQTPPASAFTWPSSDVPAPNGTSGTPCARQAFTIATTSSVERGQTTTSGGAAGW